MGNFAFLSVLFVLGLGALWLYPHKKRMDRLSAVLAERCDSVLEKLESDLWKKTRFRPRSRFRKGETMLSLPRLQILIIVEFWGTSGADTLQTTVLDTLSRRMKDPEFNNTEAHCRFVIHH